MVKKFVNNGGFTLIEVVLSMAILGIIVAVFLNLFSASLIWVISGGNKGMAFNDAQKDVEEQISLNESISALNLEIVLGGKTYTIPGGLIESNQIVGKKDSTLYTFIPYVATIKLVPEVQLEGSSNTTIKVDATNTHFNASTVVQLRDKEGNWLSDLTLMTTPSTTSTTPVIKQTFDFSIPNNLVNAQGDYIIRIVSPQTGDPDEIVRSKYVVAQPKFVAVSSGTLFSSADGESWLNRTSLYGLPSFSSLLDVAAFGNRFVAVGVGGTVLVSQEQQPWIPFTVGGGKDLHGVIWSNEFSKYYAVGADSKMLASSDGLNWSTSVDANTSDAIDEVIADELIRDPTSDLEASDFELNEISSLELSSSSKTIVAVGNYGIITSSSNGSDWVGQLIKTADYATNGALSINGIASGLISSVPTYVAVGDQGYIYKSTDGSTWMISKEGTEQLNDIYYKSSTPSYFIAVGDNGTILISSDAQNWTPLKVGSSNLNGVSGFGNLLVIVGSDGTVLNSADDTNGYLNWSNKSIGSSDLYSVVAR